MERRQQETARMMREQEDAYREAAFGNNDNDDRPSGGGTPFSDIQEQSSREDRFGEAGRYMNKGGDVTKQMKKSGLTSKK